MDKYETQAKYNIAETCACSISISDLVSLSEQANTSPSALSLSTSSTKLSYGSIRGSSALRTNIANLYSARSTASSPLSTRPRLTPENILITSGAISANFLVLYTLLSAGDHVICHYPTYSQLYQVPRSLGAEVSFWQADPSQAWQLDVSVLRSLIRSPSATATADGRGKTKLLILNNPNNPTGSVIAASTLSEIAAIAAAHNIAILCDEVYRPLFHSLSPTDPDLPPSALNININTTPQTPQGGSGYPNIIVTGSMSKAFSLAGIRVGWIASPSLPLINQFASSRHYTTISVSQLDDAVAAFALADHCVHALLGRNIALARTNLGLLEEFVREYRGRGWCEWVRPVAGTTAFVRFTRDGRAVDDAMFCRRLVEERGVLLVPGGLCFGDMYNDDKVELPDGDGARDGGQRQREEGEFAGYVRIGFVNSTDVVREGLDELRRFMREEFESVPLWRSSRDGKEL